jgi:glucose/arabinose dehydrogenase
VSRLVDACQKILGLRSKKRKKNTILPCPLKFCHTDRIIFNQYLNFQFFFVSIASWIMANYPVLVQDARLYALWSFVVLNTAIVLLFLCIGGLTDAGNALSRVVGILTTILSLVSCAAFYFADSFMMKLFFEPGLVEATHSAGFWELAAANVCSLVGSVMLCLYPVIDNTKTTAKKATKKENDAKNATPQKKSENSLRDFSLRAGALLIALIAIIYVNAQSYNTFSDPMKVSEMILPTEGGFSVHVFADGVPEARSMAVSPRGNIFVGTRMTGDVYVIADRDNNKRADHIWKIATGLVMPNGIAFKDNALYVAEPDKLWRFDDIDIKLEHMMEKYEETAQYEKPKVRDASKFFKPKLLHKDWPMYQHHGWRYMKFGPDGRLYVAFGAPCNVCKRNDTWFATIMRKTNPLGDDWNDWEVYASGIRNSVGFDWHPTTGELWFTDNGRDWGSHDYPPGTPNMLQSYFGSI